MRGEAWDKGLGEQLDKRERQKGEGGEGVGAQELAWERHGQESGIISHTFIYLCLGAWHLRGLCVLTNA